MLCGLKLKAHKGNEERRLNFSGGAGAGGSIAKPACVWEGRASNVVKEGPELKASGPGFKSWLGHADLPSLGKLLKLSVSRLPHLSNGCG